MRRLSEGKAVETLAEMAELFKVLSHPARLAILEMLRSGEACVCHMEADLGLRQAYTSQQLSLLRQHRLLEARREGCKAIYSVCDPEIFAVIDMAVRIVGPSARPRAASHPDELPKCMRCAEPAKGVQNRLPEEPSRS